MGIWLTPQTYKRLPDSERLYEVCVCVYIYTDMNVHVCIYECVGVYEGSLLDMKRSRYICREVERCREEKIVEGEKEGV